MVKPTRPVPREGSDLIKDFVQEAEQRRVICRFARTGKGLTPRPPGHLHSQGPFRPPSRRARRYPQDERQEVRSGTPVHHVDNQQEEDMAAVVEGLFSTKHVHRNRQISLTPAMLPAAAAAAATGLGLNNKPIFTFTRRKLQMESVSTQGQRSNDSSHRAAVLMSTPAVSTPTSQQLGHRPRVSQLAAKLDAILRSSPWMRRKVVVQLQPNNRSQRNVSSLRLLSNHATSAPPLHTHHELIDVSSGSTNDKHQRARRKNISSSEDTSDMEKRIMVTFQRFVRVWRERKRRLEQAALSIVNGNSSSQPNAALSPSNGTSGRHGDKLRREVEAQSSNVASILSRRMISEVPALKFFDEGDPVVAEQSGVEYVSAIAARAMTCSSDTGGETMASPKMQLRTISDLMVSSSFKAGGLITSPLRRTTPSGVCYTLDASGCRRIKMQSGSVRSSRAGMHASQSQHKKIEDITVERATSKSLRRKMIRRVKIKHQAIGRMTEDFEKSKKVLTAKLGSQLALRQAESERMFGKRLSLLLSDDVELPPHMVSKELSLARLRFKKASIQASCQTLAVLGAALHHVETAGEVSGRDISSGEQHFLELLRCAVEGDHAMTPLLIEGILGQFNLEQRQKPLVAGLLGLLERAVPDMQNPQNIS